MQSFNLIHTIKLKLLQENRQIDLCLTNWGTQGHPARKVNILSLSCGGISQQLTEEKYVNMISRLIKSDHIIYLKLFLSIVFEENLAKTTWSVKIFWHLPSLVVAEKKMKFIF